MQIQINVFISSLFNVETPEIILEIQWSNAV